MEKLTIIITILGILLVSIATAITLDNVSKEKIPTEDKTKLDSNQEIKDTFSTTNLDFTDVQDYGGIKILYLNTDKHDDVKIITAKYDEWTK